MWNYASKERVSVNKVRWSFFSIPLVSKIRLNFVQVLNCKLCCRRLQQVRRLGDLRKKTAVPCWVFAHIIFGHAFSILFSVTGAERCCDPSRLSQFAFGSFLVSSFQHKYCLDDVAKMRGKHVVACGHTASDKSSAAEAKFITLSVAPAFQDFSGIPWVVVVSFFRLCQGCKSAQFERWRGGFCATGVSFLLACLQCLQC